MPDILVHIDNYVNEIKTNISECKKKLQKIDASTRFGKVTSAVGTTIRSTIENVNIGDLCLVVDEVTKTDIKAEVIAFQKNEALLLPLGTIQGLSQRAVVVRSQERFQIAVGDFLLGKVVDGFCNVIADMSEKAPQNTEKHYYSVMQAAPPPLTRPLISEPFSTGIKSVDMFTTCGKGQRLAIFAGPGVGKTTLLGMLLRGCEADVIVVALIGERGREVKEFIDIELNKKTKEKTIMVVSTSDKPPVEHVKSAYVAQTVAEYFRDQGKTVLLLVDSITRFARAQREVGLSAGEPVSRGGFPPSVFLSFPRLMERAGNSAKGSITAFYTVLLEGEAIEHDPIADEVKSIIDGHIVLSRKLAEQGHFPAVNVLTSLSRIADRIITDKHKESARKLRLLLSKYEEVELLLRVGEYQKGNDTLTDEAVRKNKEILKYLQQPHTSSIEYQTAVKQLLQIAGS
ncbi:MAG: FliI/YscN family ATPase [Bdellovibrionota bacterium]